MFKVFRILHSKPQTILELTNALQQIWHDLPLSGATGKHETIKHGVVTGKRETSRSVERPSYNSSKTEMDVIVQG